MPDPAPRPATIPRLVAVAVGNTRTRTGSFVDGELADAASHEHAHPGAAADAVRASCTALAQRGGPEPIVVIASVSPHNSDALLADLCAHPPGAEVYRVGRDIAIDLTTSLQPDAALLVGQDRLLSALGAFTMLGQACIVVDIGTAITVDFVDGEGVFHGGAIAPGLRLMLDALHTGTAQLPKVAFTLPPPDRAWGSNTADAINLGVVAAIRGMVRWSVERDAVAYGSYPLVLATGGDAGLLEDEGIVDRFVPDLQLLGIRVACERALGDALP